MYYANPGVPIIDQPIGTHHPRLPEVIYPLDYCFLEGTTASDRRGIDIWVGSSGKHDVSSIILTVDILERDSEIKILLGCTERENQTILDFHNTNNVRAILVCRTSIMES